LTFTFNGLERGVLAERNPDGAKTTTQAVKNVARAALQLELFLNLLAIAQNFPRQPE
jgi:hypothetical protein